MSARDLSSDPAAVDGLLADYLHRTRAGRTGARLLPGLCITDDEIDDVRSRLRFVVSEELTARLQHLRQRLDLSAADLNVITICLAPDLDPQYERVFAYLQDDVARRRPSIDLLLRLLSSSAEGREQVRRRLSADAPLGAWQLIRVADDDAGSCSILHRLVRVDEQIVDYLCGTDTADCQVQGWARRVIASSTPDELALAPELTERLHRLALVAREASPPPVVSFYGPRGSGKQTAAALFCASGGAGLLVAGGASLSRLDDAVLRQASRLLAREARLHEMPVYIDEADRLLCGDRGNCLHIVLEELQCSGSPAILGSRRRLSGRVDGALAEIEFPPPDVRQRAAVWADALGAEATGTEISEISGAFRLTPGQIRHAASRARVLASASTPPRCTLVHLREACRAESVQSLARFGRYVVPRRSWDDLVLPPDRMQQLREICRAARYRHRVYDDWGFDAKLPLGRGLNALFTGPAGTGKTMAAEVLASDLGLDLYKIDLSAVVSKYIGETEKHLSQVFAEAESANAILFFDEADALFGRRTEVRDAHDRYANVEVSYLLTRLEAHDGLVILASNFRKNVDEAFVRRMHFIAEFPLPEYTERCALWRSIWPSEAPLGADLDVGFLARQFELSGGNIRNAALAAAFLAAEEQTAISMPHVIAGVRREFQKMGTVILDAGCWTYPAPAALRREDLRATSCETEPASARPN